MHVEVGDIISLKVVLNKSEKTIDYALFSKILNRPVTVEEINGTAFMEARLEEELEKENRLIIEEDILLAVDLIYLWAKTNGYFVTHDGMVEAGRQQQKKAPSTSSSSSKASE